LRRRHSFVAAAGSCLLLVASVSYSGAAQAATLPAVSQLASTESVTEDFGRPTFTNSTSITNPWLPLVPGTHWAWEGQANVDGERIARRVELTITDLTKMIDDVRTVVAYELDYNDGQLIEAELIFFAQDDQGNVWHLGQYPEEYEEGVFVAAPAWIHGYQGASAGIFMQVAPQLGAPSYSQGWGPAVGWSDRGQVSQMGQYTCVRVGCYENVLVVSEFNRTEPDAQQLKFYAPGVGNVRVGWAGAGEQEQEELILVRHTRLSPQAMATVRDAVLVLETHAYDRRHEVYKYTRPAEQAPA
jgi:hypothetical protein